MRGWVLLVGLIFCYVRPAVPHLCGCICGLVLVLHLHGPFWTFPTWMCVCVCVSRPTHWPSYTAPSAYWKRPWPSRLPYTHSPSNLRGCEVTNHVELTMRVKNPHGYVVLTMLAITHIFWVIQRKLLVGLILRRIDASLFLESSFSAQRSRGAGGALFVVVVDQLPPSVKHLSCKLTTSN